MLVRGGQSIRPGSSADAAAALLRRMRSPVNDAYSNTMAYLRKAGRNAEVLALNAEFRARTVEVAGGARTAANFVKGHSGLGTGSEVKDGS